MPKYANQRILTNMTPKSEKNFTAFDNDLRDKHLPKLTLTAKLLWIELSSHKTGFQLDWSPQKFSNSYGISRSAYYRAMDELYELNYVVLSSNTNIFYFFADTYTQQDIIEVLNIEKEFLHKREKQLTWHQKKAFNEEA